MLYNVFKPVVVVLLRLIWRPRLEGGQHIPARGGVILASNHLSIADTYVMPAQVRRTVHFLAKADYYAGGSLFNRVLGLFLRSIGVMPINRTGGSASRAALATGLDLLADGKVLGIYPEGTRSPDGRLYRGKTGAARMALESGCPIIPVAMIGAFEAHRGRHVLPRRHPRIRTVIGAPLDARALADASGAQLEGARLRAVTDAMMAAIRDLSGQEYVDEYASEAKRRLAAQSGQE